MARYVDNIAKRGGSKETKDHQADYFSNPNKDDEARPRLVEVFRFCIYLQIKPIELIHCGV